MDWINDRSNYDRYSDYVSDWYKHVFCDFIPKRPTTNQLNEMTREQLLDLIDQYYQRFQCIEKYSAQMIDIIKRLDPPSNRRKQSSVRVNNTSLTVNNTESSVGESLAVGAAGGIAGTVIFDSIFGE